MLHFVTQSVPHVAGKADVTLYVVVLSRGLNSVDFHILGPECHSALVAGLHVRVTESREQTQFRVDNDVIAYGLYYARNQVVGAYEVCHKAR